ncbi:MAG: hypothetical protein A2622_06505 [Bdellovibrionales bacterium RIFCSPHIGHO2_01_FULL_40_29]|nr:MAG: hypothetical protein A2622_06505 [Bdellovibrionales bacterium RIFCSPHIGHO2_01_FULL_40_29]OFZ35094.1 MAG: hypothetical protein A3D17_06855 [Bdellovibrionales bacterium RIFCSPHIGHO2_02_FULL_40_15]
MSTEAWSQTSIGIYESLLGGSGVAISESTAASYYNPSLLKNKKDQSYSLSASAFGIYSSKTDTSETKSATLYPTYLSSIIVGNALVHEIFFYSAVPARYSTNSEITDSSSINRSESEVDLSYINFGYSMAFRSFPLALSYFGEFLQMKASSVHQFTSLVSAARTTTVARMDSTALGVGISASGHFTNSGYTMGYNFKSRRHNVYKSGRGTGTSSVYDPILAPEFQVIETTPEARVEPTGYSVSIGHGFKSGDHEFLTDSHLQEKTDLSSVYDLTQTFGYRLTSDAGHQYLCGISHLINSDVKYFGQSAYYSTGYSWQTRALRSSIGIYYYSSKLNQDDIFAMGLSFGSEFSY